MKRNLILFGILLLILVIPVKIKAFEYKGVEYQTLNLDEALTQEQIEHDFSNYKENDKQITIYVFRGNGCGFCRALLTHLKDIVPELGKYFKVVSFEVWYDNNNSALYQEVAAFLGKQASGVPFYIIGDKVFADGYAENLDSEIEKAIKEAYNSKDRYDVFEEMKHQPKEITNGTIIIWSLVFTLIGTALSTGLVLGITHRQNRQLITKIDSLENYIKKELQPKQTTRTTKTTTRKTTKKASK